MDLFFAMGGILMSVALARLYAKYGFRFLNHLSPTSYTIYLYHGIFQAFKGGKTKCVNTIVGLT